MTRTAAVTRRRWHTYRARSAAWVDWRTGVVALGPGAAGYNLGPRCGLADLLAGVGGEVERIFLIGGRPGDTPDGFAAWMAAPGPGWAAAAGGHYLSRPDQFTLNYCGPGRRAVAIVAAGGWFGAGAHSPAVAAAAWAELARVIGAAFEGGVLLASPATTGRDLFLRSLGDGRAYPVAAPEYQDLIRSTTGQGRDELRPAPAGVEQVEGLAEYDGRLMYGALCRELGSGVIGDDLARGAHQRRRLVEDFRADPYRRARYLAEWRVPAGWDHVGLLGEWTGEGWRYRSGPGEMGTGWVEGSELAVAAAAGWHFDIARRLTLDRPPGVGPLDRWAKKLAACRETLRAQSSPAGDLAAVGARAILLHSIGSFMGRPQWVTRSVPIERAGEVPDNARDPRIEGPNIVFGVPGPAAWQELSHPEWSAAIYGRCRARLLTGPGGVGALHVEGRQVVAFRTDALYLATRPAGWVDTGAVGRLRLVGWRAGPVSWPATRADLRALRDQGRAGGHGPN